MSFNLAVILRETAQAAPNRPALVFEGGRLTYAELEEAAGRMAAGLRRAGIGAGDAVGVMLPNVPQFVITYFAALRVGAVVVPMNVLLKPREVKHYLDDSGAKILIAWEDPGVGDLPVRTLGPSFDELLQADYDPELEPTGFEDVAVLIYTSGTTGSPKGAELTHAQLLLCADTGGRIFGVRDDDVVCGVLPFFHVFGLSSVLNVCMRFGATISLVPRFSPDAVLSAIETDQITVMEGVPTMFFALLNHPKFKSYDTGSLRVAVSGGASIPGTLIEQFEKACGVVILEGYGLSETAAMATFNRSAEERRVLSIGKPLWGVEVRVVDDDDRPLPPGEDHIGELVIRGFNVMKGYHGHPEATAEVFRNGWFHTGDLGYVDEDGFFFLVDRKKDLIIRGGYNVYPSEIETVLHEHPSVAEVAVVGVPDDRLGEEVLAVVVAAPGASFEEKELVGWCKERLASYKYPRQVKVVDELPKNAIGKVIKRELAGRS
jgi:long-chain acyl-CoA synthetase